MTANGRNLRDDINAAYQVAIRKLAEDGYVGVELERLAARMIEAYIAGRNSHQALRRVA